jgi:hypothetical protein
MTSQLLILDSVVDLDSLSIDFDPSVHTTVVSFCDDVEWLDSVVDQLERGGAAVEAVNGAQLLAEQAPAAKKAFLDGVAAAPNGMIGSKTLETALGAESGVTLWWLHETSTRRSDSYSTFTRFTQMFVVRELVNQASVDRVVLVSTSPDFANVVSQFINTLKCDFVLYGQPVPNGAVSGTNRWLLWATLFHARRWLEFLIRLLIAKLLLGFRSSTKKYDIAFNTHFPQMWLGSGLARDEKYSTVGAAVIEKSGRPVVDVVSVTSDGMLQHLSLMEYFRAVRRLSNLRLTRILEPEIELVDRFSSILDCLRLLNEWRVIFRLWRLERSSDFRKIWVIDGIDLWPFVLMEHRTSAVRIPILLFHRRRIKRLVDNLGISTLVVSLYEFVYGRATILGARSANHQVRVVGTQHGPGGQYKLMYHPPLSDFQRRNPIPFPDTLIVEGEGDFAFAASSGIPSDTVVIGGTPRIDYLSKISAARKAGANDTGIKPEILVAFSQHNSRSLISVIRYLVENLDSGLIRAKLHPRAQLDSEQLMSELSGLGNGLDFEIVETSITEALSTCSHVISTYTSVGMEAAVLGISVVVLRQSSEVSQTQLTEIDEPHVQIVDSPKNALAAIVGNGEMISVDAETKKRVGRLLFGPMNAESIEIWSNTIIG